jgi:hypothetical protein
MEKLKNKGILKKLYLPFPQSNRHGKRKHKTDEKPEKRKFQADLSEQIEFESGIIPNVKMQNTIDEQSDEKFRNHDESRTKQASENERRISQPAVQKQNDRKAKTSCQDHGRMCISAP